MALLVSTTNNIFKITDSRYLNGNSFYLFIKLITERKNINTVIVEIYFNKEEYDANNMITDVFIGRFESSFSDNLLEQAHTFTSQFFSNIDSSYSFNIVDL